MIQDQIKSYNDATRALLDIPIRNEEEYQKWELWLKEWGDPKVTKYLPLPEEWVNKILDQMNEFKNRPQGRRPADTL